MAAGLDLIGSTGYRQLTLRSLCKAAGLNDRYFYESFENMECLLRALYEHHMGVMQARIETIAATTEGALQDRLRHGIFEYFRLMSDRRLAKLALTEILGVSDGVDEMYRSTTQRFGKMLTDMLVREFPALNMPEDAEKALGLSLAGACTMPATHWMLEDYKIDIEVMTQTSTDIFIGILGQVIARHLDASGARPASAMS